MSCQRRLHEQFVSHALHFTFTVLIIFCFWSLMSYIMLDTHQFLSSCVSAYHIIVYQPVNKELILQLYLVSSWTTDMKTLKDMLVPAIISTGMTFSNVGYSRNSMYFLQQKLWYLLVQTNWTPNPYSRPGIHEARLIQAQVLCCDSCKFTATRASQYPLKTFFSSPLSIQGEECIMWS